MALSHDLGTYTILTGGCYIFAVLPHRYPNRVAASTASASDTTSGTAVALREALIAKKPDVLGGVPWVFEELMRLQTSASGPDEELSGALARLRVCLTGGADPSESMVNWAMKMKIPLVLDIGMTELGGESFLQYLHTVGFHKWLPWL